MRAQPHLPGGVRARGRYRRFCWIQIFNGETTPNLRERNANSSLLECAWLSHTSLWHAVPRHRAAASWLNANDPCRDPCRICDKTGCFVTFLTRTGRNRH
jgi:hypothetical protein